MPDECQTKKTEDRSVKKQQSPVLPWMFNNSLDSFVAARINHIDEHDTRHNVPKIRHQLEGSIANVEQPFESK
jgi:hypothetical protein